MVEVTDRAGWQREVVEASRERPVVVDFWAPWCQPCRVLGPVLERLAADDAGRWSLVKVDVQAHPELAQPYGVEGIPAVFGFRGGEVVDRFTGALPAGAVRTWLDGLAPDPCAEAVAAGELARRSGDLALARAEFERALTLDPTSPGALLGLAELDPAGGWLARLPAELSAPYTERRARLVLAAEGAGADVGALRARVGTDPRDLDARWTLAAALTASGDAGGAAEQWLEIVRLDRKYRDDGGRKALLALFATEGPDSAVTRTWRGRLQMELYK